jgi:hypothetical protein
MNTKLTKGVRCIVLQPVVRHNKGKQIVHAKAYDLVSIVTILDNVCIVEHERTKDRFSVKTELLGDAPDPGPPLLST